MTDRRPSLLYRIMCWSRFGWHHGYTTQVAASESKRTYSTRPRQD